jgi:hypothetical protein
VIDRESVSVSICVYLWAPLLLSNSQQYPSENEGISINWRVSELWTRDSERCAASDDDRRCSVDLAPSRKGAKSGWFLGVFAALRDTFPDSAPSVRSSVRD